MNKALLCGIMKQYGYSQEKLADLIGVDRSTFNRKLNGYRKGFCVSEARAVGIALQMTDKQIIDVFFGAQDTECHDRQCS